MILYSEYRLIENEKEVCIAWKGICGCMVPIMILLQRAHLLLFFLAFLFGCFCTFCFHMLSYMFDEQCVLFPKLLALNKERNTILFSFLPIEGNPEYWPVDFITTQWVDKSVCVLPTFVPLVSGIFGLVWTTMFVMCTSAMTQHGLERPWRIILPLFFFSVIMGVVCLCTTIITQTGLDELCVKLGQATGSSGCSYTINVITLAYSRRIRGVYQATWLIVIAAWMHTLCWLLSAVVALLRVILVVDFNLICITATLEGNYEKLTQQTESQVRLTEPEFSSTGFGSKAYTVDDEGDFKDSSKVELFYQTNTKSRNPSASTLLSAKDKSSESVEPADNKLKGPIMSDHDDSDRNLGDDLRNQPLQNTLNNRVSSLNDLEKANKSRYFEMKQRPSSETNIEKSGTKPNKSNLRASISDKDKKPDSQHIKISTQDQKDNNKKGRDKHEKQKDD